MTIFVAQRNTKITKVVVRKLPDCIISSYQVITKKSVKGANLTFLY